MSDPRSTIGREMQRVELRPFTLETFHRRRDRKRRNQRVTAGVVASIVAVAALGLVLRAIGTDRSERSAARIVVHPGSIAFVGRKSGPGTGLFVFDPSTGRTSILVDLRCSSDPGGVRSCPAERVNGIDWSPDGTRIAYALRSERCCYADTEPPWVPAQVADGIYVLDLRTGQTQRLTGCDADCSYEGGIDWSPDGSTIAYAASIGGGPMGIWTMNADGSGQERVDTGSLAAWNPSWSPDGSQIAFDGVTVGAVGDGLYRVASDGGTPQAIDTGSGPATPSALWYPAWSPDGTRIAYIEQTCGPAGLPWVYRFGDAASRRLPVGTTCQGVMETAPAWSPDGGEIAVTADGWLYTVRPDGTGLTKLTRAWAAPAWYPGTIGEG